jgi:hypothetical protein
MSTTLLVAIPVSLVIAAALILGGLGIYAKGYRDAISDVQHDKWGRP